MEIIVAGTILRDVAEGQLHFSDRVGEAAYASKCEVSRTPVRRALDWLKERGLVEMRPSQGAFIRVQPQKARKVLAQKRFQWTAAEKAGEPGFMDTARRLKEMLSLPGGLPEGVLKDSVVARKLNVSRTTANRAMALLARENVLEPLPRRGWRRSYLSLEQFLDWYDYRIALEPAAFEAAWRSMDKQKVDQLQAETAKATKPAHLSKLSAAQRVRLDSSLHGMIQEYCANGFLKRALEQVEAQRLISVSPSWQVPMRAKETFEEHLEVLRAIQAGNKQRAVRALITHLKQAKAHAGKMAREMKLDRLTSGAH